MQASHGRSQVLYIFCMFISRMIWNFNHIRIFDWVSFFGIIVDPSQFTFGALFFWVFYLLDVLLGLSLFCWVCCILLQGILGASNGVEFLVVSFSFSSGCLSFFMLLMGNTASVFFMFQAAIRTDGPYGGKNIAYLTI